MNLQTDRRLSSRRSEDRKWLRFQRLVLVYLTVMVATAVLGVGLILATAVGYSRGRFRFDSQTYSASTSSLCPGQVLAFDLVLIVDRGPLLLEWSDSWWDVAAGYTAIFGQHHQAILLEAQVISRPWRVSVPDLPAGAYQYRLAATERGSATRAFYVPFTIPDNCP